MEKIIQVQWATNDIEEARVIAKFLLKNRLVACANLLPGVESHFHWEGKIESEEEVKVFFKTTLVAFEKVKEVIEEKSSYDVPEITYCILAGGNVAYTEWVEQNVQA